MLRKISQSTIYATRSIYDRRKYHLVQRIAAPYYRELRYFSNDVDNDSNNNNKFEEQSKEDLAIYQSFHSFSGLLKFSLSLMNLSKSENEKFRELAEKGLAKEDSFHHYSLFLYLQHPLLMKYGFDIYEFDTGVRYAFEAVHRAIASRDFYNYAESFSANNGDSDTKSEANELLKDTLSPALYKASVEAVAYLQGGGQDMIMSDVEVKNVEISDVATSIVREIKNSDNPQIYVPGSVVATISAFIEAEETYLVYRSFDSTAADGDIEQTTKDSAQQDNSAGGKEDSKQGLFDVPEELNRQAKYLWTFRGCISGQTELDWQIIGIDGRGLLQAPPI